MNYPVGDYDIRINLSEVEKAKAMADKVELQDIRPREDYLLIKFGLKAAK